MQATLLAVALSGCAVTFEDDVGRRHVVGALFSAHQEEDSTSEETLAVNVQRFVFYGLWVNDAFARRSVAVGRIEFAVADLPNAWPLGSVRQNMISVSSDDCGWFWCVLNGADPNGAGVAHDLSIGGIGIEQVEDDGFRFAVGYHREVVLRVTKNDALVQWAGDVPFDELLQNPS